MQDKRLTLAAFARELAPAFISAWVARVGAVIYRRLKSPKPSVAA